MAEERCGEHRYQTLDSQGCPICKQLLTPEKIEEIVAKIVMAQPFVSSIEEQTERLKLFAREVSEAQLAKSQVCPEKKHTPECIKHKAIFGGVGCICQGTGKMDKQELREKIARKVCVICDEYNFGTQNCNIRNDNLCHPVLAQADQIIAPIPDEEEKSTSQFHCKQCGITEKRESVKGNVVYSDGICSRCLAYEADIRKQERERIIGIINDLSSFGYPYGSGYKDAILQALT